MTPVSSRAVSFLRHFAAPWGEADERVTPRGKETSLHEPPIRKIMGKDCLRLAIGVAAFSLVQQRCRAIEQRINSVASVTGRV